jgi:hypothetical protein
MKQKEFEKAFKEVLKKYNISYIKEFDVLRATILTSLGVLQIGCLDGWIAMRFISDDFSVSKFFAEFPKENINRHSFKWNLHCHEKENCILELKNRLNKLNILKIT